MEKGSYVVRLALGVLSVFGGLAVSRISFLFSDDSSASGQGEWVGIVAAVLVAAGIFLSSSVLLSAVRKKPAPKTVNIDALTDWFEACERHEASRLRSRAGDSEAAVSPFRPAAAHTSTPSSGRQAVLVTGAARRKLG